MILMFVIVLQICSLLRGGIAERGGVRVGHRIIEINNQSVVAVPHERIVNLLATSVGEVGTIIILTTNSVIFLYVITYIQVLVPHAIGTARLIHAQNYIHTYLFKSHQIRQWRFVMHEY